MKSILAGRVEKASKLTFVDQPGVSTTSGSTWGGDNDRYTVSLFQKKEWGKVPIADKTIDTVVIAISCKRLDITNGELNPMEDCMANCHYMVCYHSLGYLKHKLAERCKTISFFEDILAALNGLNFGGQLTKVISKQGGQGFVWAVVRDKFPDVIASDISEAAYQEEDDILSPATNINLMRGNEDDEGID